jgi:hypothetical protein
MTSWASHALRGLPARGRDPVGSAASSKRGTGENAPRGERGEKSRRDEEEEEVRRNMQSLATIAEQLEEERRLYLHINIHIKKGGMGMGVGGGMAYSVCCCCCLFFVWGADAAGTGGAPTAAAPSPRSVRHHNTTHGKCGPPPSCFSYHFNIISSFSSVRIAQHSRRSGRPRFWLLAAEEGRRAPQGTIIPPRLTRYASGGHQARTRRN